MPEIIRSNLGCSMTQSSMRFSIARRFAVLLAATLFALAPVLSGIAVAKPGGGGSVGSRGTRTFSAPAATPTAPTGATPFNRTAAPPAAPSASAPRPGFGAQPQAGLTAARPGSRFGTGFMAGLLGAGLFGALLGSGVMGGLGGVMSFIGLILQMALIFMIIGLAVRWYRSRSQSQPVMAGPRQGAPRQPLSSSPMPSMSAAQTGGAAPAPSRPVEIAPPDYEAFERLLADVQTAYSSENIQALKSVATPEMVSYFEEELTENNRRGLVNRVSNVKLLQGDLSEAWGEPGGQYATVAMRYALTDEMLDRTTGKPAPGSRNTAQEATEIWTFVRPANSPSPQNWRLSAIQQAA